MSNHRIRWKALQERRRQTGYWIRLDGATVRKASNDGGYEIVIQGVNLRPHVVPPVVTVGKQTVQNLQFEPQGRQLIGSLEARPEGPEVVVDYGFARASCEVTY